MLDNPRIRELLEKILETGQSPEEVCCEFPELLPEVRDRWSQLQAVEAHVNALFPPSSGDASRALTRSSAPGKHLPAISGYELRSILGHGGVGVVYKAHHIKLNRPVAIKMLLSGAYAGLQERMRFEREAQAVAALLHPNIVQIYDVGEFDGRLYFAMELVEGGTLSTKLGGTPLPAADAAALAAILADAIHEAHDRRIIHRDLKPANVLLAADGTPKISDFGLALRLDDDASLTVTGARIGTPSYMAPEQALGKTPQSGPAVDIYSLGALLYEMLTGRPPFRGESAAETQRQVIRDEPAPPTRLNAKVPRDLETICLKCLAKEPSQRYETAAALAADLRRFQRGDTISARRAGFLERGIRWIRRNPVGTALLVSVALLLIVAGVAGFREWALSTARTAELSKWAERLEFVLRLQNEGRFAEARAILGRVPDAGSRQLALQIVKAQTELDVVEALDRVLMARVESGSRDFDRTAAEAAYREAFRVAGIDVLDSPSAQVAAEIAATNVKSAIVAAIDDWSHWTPDESSRRHLLEINRLADPDPWRDRVRDPDIWSDANALKELAATANTDEHSAQLLLMLAHLLETNDVKATDFYRRVQMSHPDDFFANFSFAETLAAEGEVEDAVGFYRAALVVRPQAVAPYINLGAALTQLGRTAEAMEYWRQSLAINSDSIMVHLNLAIAALNQDLFEEALKYAEHALRIDPQSGYAFAVIGQALLNQGHFTRARPAIQSAVDLLPPSEAFRELAVQALENCDRNLELESQVNAILRGAAQPVDGAHRLEFAELLYIKGRYCDAARLFKEGLLEASSLGEDELATNRYDGARSALGCAATLKADAQSHDDLAAQWRKLALDWLEANLVYWTKKAKDGTDEERAQAAYVLAYWRQDDDLATVREPTDLGKLTENERSRCQAFWTTVDALQSIAAGQ